MKRNTIRSITLEILLVLTLFQCSCSDEKAGPKTEFSYVPFPPKPVRELTGEEKKLLERDDFVKIEPGEFFMGSHDKEIGHQANETVHRVRITKPYYMGVSEVTIDQWNMLQPEALKRDEKFFLPDDLKELIIRLKKESESKVQIQPNPLALNPNDPVYTVKVLEQVVLTLRKKLEKNQEAKKKKQSVLWAPVSIQGFLKKLENFIRARKFLPLTDVSYPQAKSFCWRRTEQAWQAKTIPKDMVFRLPTEAEWEHACRAGLKGVCGLEEGDNLSGMNANINGGKKEFIIGETPYLINQKGLVSVGVSKTKYPANAWGIHDMHGNVYEWCYDYYEAYPVDSLTIDPMGPVRGKERVLRGGSFLSTAHGSRSAARHSVEPSWRGSEIGFRLVLGYPL